jgi:hypothetical protein
VTGGAERRGQLTPEQLPGAALLHPVSLACLVVLL